MERSRTTCPLCKSSDSTLAYRGTDLLHGGDEEYAYYDCGYCQAVYQWPVPTAEQIHGFYPDDYAVYQPEKPKAPRGLERAVLRSRHGYKHLDAPLWARALAPLVGLFKYRDALPFVEGGRLVDVGCGNGKFLLAMRHLGWEVAGVDMDARAVAVCREQGLEVYEDLESAPGPFDVVTARHVIEHVADPRAFRKSLFGCWVRGRRPMHVHIRTPNADALGRRRYGAYWYANDIPRHLVLFTPGNLLRLFGGRARTRSTPKILLNSRDARRGRAGRASRYGRLARLGARPAVWLSRLVGRGYEIVLDAQWRSPPEEG